MGKPSVDTVTNDLIEDVPDSIFETVDWDEHESDVKQKLIVADNPEPTIALLFKWISSLNDPIQYKPQSGTINPQEVYIAVDVPKKYFLEYELKEGFTHDTAENSVLTLEGYAWVQNTISAKLLKTYEEFKY